MADSTDQSSSGQSIPAKMREKHDAIVTLIDPFCREHLNDEYLGMCRRLAGMLAHTQSNKGHASPKAQSSLVR